MNGLLRARWWLGIGVVLIAFGGGLWWWNNRTTCTILEYQRARDVNDLLHIFADDSYWLDARPAKDALAAFARELEHVEHPEWKPTHEGPMQWRIAHCGSKTVGFISFYHKGSNRARILYLGVDKDYRKKGLGRDLMKAAIAALQAQGIREIIIATRIENFRAQNLYRQLGFATTSTEGDFIFLELHAQ
ncbi:TPA: hypothetical protein DCW54_03320 [Candidatus Dependentiae bacterium]|nr:hypothetical protein [Candidatus Dependentiae bacterium]